MNKKLTSTQIRNLESDFSIKYQDLVNDDYYTTYIFIYHEQREMFSDTVIEHLQSLGKLQKIDMKKRTIEILVSK